MLGSYIRNQSMRGAQEALASRDRVKGIFQSFTGPYSQTNDIPSNHFVSPHGSLLAEVERLRPRLRREKMVADGLAISLPRYLLQGVGIAERLARFLVENPQFSLEEEGGDLFLIGAKTGEAAGALFKI